MEVLIPPGLRAPVLLETMQFSSFCTVAAFVWPSSAGWIKGILTSAG